MTALLVALVLFVALVPLLLIRYRASRPRPPKLPHREFPLVGLDDQVRFAIEAGDSDDRVRKYAENVAIRDWNATHPLEQIDLHQLPHREASWRVGHQAVSVPHVTATTPKVPSWREALCQDCEFEALVSLDAAIAIPIRTLACPQHREER